MISAILLAAGASRRFQGNKLLEPLRSKPLILHTLDTLLACPLQEVIVVTGHDEEGLRRALRDRPCRLVSNPRHKEGMSRSIQAGLEAVGESSTGLMICLGDMPLLRPSELIRLMEAFESDTERIVAPMAAGRQANPVILPRSLWGEIRALRGDVGCKEILARHADRTSLLPLPSVSVLQDADTPEAMARLRRRMEEPLSGLCILVRGAGEMASGVAHRLARSHFRVCLTELPQPLAIRRQVCFSEAVHEGTALVQGVLARRVSQAGELELCWRRGEIPLLVDSEAAILKSFDFDAVVDGVMAKRNTGTRLAHAPLVIGLGPGFEAGRDVHLVVETNRGHRLGSVLWSGCAEPDTGLPGPVLGYSAERVVKSPAEGIFQGSVGIGETVSLSQLLGRVGDHPVQAALDGVLRGIIRSGTPVRSGTKLADIDPRGDAGYCAEVSDKARTISGGVLEAILMYFNL